MTSPRLRLGRHALVLSLVCGALYACSSDDPGPVVVQPTGPVLRGRVMDANGGPIEGVKVSVGAQSATTNAAGQYTLTGAGGEIVARFSKTGFIDGLERIKVGTVVTTQLDATLLAAAAPVPLDATAGGEVAGARGVKVVVPPSSLVDKNGAPVTGMVDVVLTPIDPSKMAEVQAAPGDFFAAQAGQPTMIESFGMIDITIKRGEDKLQVAPGKELDIRIPAPEGLANPDPSMPLWSFDEAKGIWVDEGIATYDPETRTYVAKAKHMSFWNADKPYLATCVCGQVKEKGKGLLGGARVVANGTTYFGTSEATTDDAGKFCIAVRKDSGVNVAAYHKSGGGQSRAIQSGAADTAVPPQAGDGRCVDVGTWEVEKDVYIAADGTRQTCDAVPSLFANSCARGLGEQISSCFNPSGECVIKSTGEITFGNGSRIASDGVGKMTYYSPSGAVCLTVDGFADQVDPEKPVIRYRLPSGDVFEFAIDGTSGGYSIKCPSGEVVTMTAEQQSAMEACGANQSGGGNSGGNDGPGCRFEGSDGGLTGNIGSPCENDATCGGGGNVCCQIPQSSKVCYPKSACDQIQQQN